MPIAALGMSHHLVSLEELSTLSAVGPDVVSSLSAKPDISGFVLLSTCNRFELYFDGPLFHPGVEAVLATLRELLPPQRAYLAEEFELHAGQMAVQHLLEVSAGLDAMVVGEAEILGQVREALAASEDHTTPGLRRLFHAALTTGKAVKSETDLGAAGRSVAEVGLNLVEERHFPLAGRRVLIVGTGSYARVVTAGLGRAGCTDIAVYSRSGRAARFAASHHLEAVASDGLIAAVGEADVVITCSGHAHATAIINADLIDRARGTASPLLPILDLSLSGDVAADAANLIGVDLIDLDEIGAHAPAEASAAVLAARDLVARGVDTYLHLESGRAATPAVTAMRSHVSQFIEREIEAAARRYDAATAAAVARSLRRVSNALLHTPSLRAAELARAGGLDDYQHALHTLFGIDVEAHP
ncbi:MAG TPA: glutamyl-tRNA reductase [Propionicimonas sp.]|nr:glutamyl-tRNA reductase [Propionicimonas sp.]